VNLAGRRIADLIDAPELTQPEHKAALTILMYGSVAFAFDGACPSLFPLSSVKQANISLKHGHSDVSAYSYMMYAFVLIAQGRYAEAYNLGKLALALNAKRNCANLSCKLKCGFATVILPYREPLRLSSSYLAQGYLDGLEVGDSQYVGFCCMNGILHRIAYGIELATIAEEVEKLFPIVQRTRDTISIMLMITAKQIVASLRGRTQGLHTLSDGVFDETEFEVKLGTSGHEFMAAFHYILKTQLAFLYQDFERALSMAALAEQGLPFVANLWPSTELRFYASLTMLALYPAATAAEQARYAREIERHEAQIGVWAESCPENFRHKHLLISAEQARVSGDEIKAMALYEQAIQAAHDHEFLHHEALANELCARFHLSNGRAKIARIYMADAVYGYARWGAEAKVAQLREKYAELLPREAEAEGARAAKPTETTTITGAAEILDIATVMKASQALSGEIELGKLLERLLPTAMENAGANKGCLLLVNDGELCVEAAAAAEAYRTHPTHPIGMLRSVPLDATEDLSQAVVRYVQKTKETVVLANGSEESTFGFDAYMGRKKPKSILCAPILHQGKLIGILYLENTLVEGAFPPSRLEVLQILAAQAAISIENSRLYGTLEDKVRERTAELREVQAKLIRLEREATEKRMAGGFAHEIRNALAGAKLVLARVLGQDEAAPRASLTLDSAAEIGKLHEALSERLSEDELDPFVERFQHIFEHQEELDAALQLVLKATSRALSITRKIMDFSRIAEVGRAAQGIRVGEVIESALADFRETLNGATIAIQTDIQDNLSILIDETQFYSILQNLLNNARDAILEKSAGGKAGVIDVKAAIEGEAWGLRVRDNGVGIRREDIEKIFESFYSTKPEAGTGLGLAVVKKIVDVNGGTIEVQSELGQGSQFTVTLPVAGPAEAE
jgi:histidine kinase